MANQVEDEATNESKKKELGSLLVKKMTNGQTWEDSTKEAKKNELEPLLQKKMSKGQTWYLISKDWWRKLQQFIGLNKENDAARPPVFPGLIDNSSLLNENGDLKDNLISQMDYELVPSEAWDLLVKWFGKVPGQDPLKRKVVELGESKQPMVEVYLISVKVCKNFEVDHFKFLRFSHTDTIGKMKKEISQVFNIPEEVETKLWHPFMPGFHIQSERLDKLDKTLQEVGISQGQSIVVETPNAKGMFRTVPFKEHFDLGSGGDMRQITQPGICGLSNMGNTCFMNSVLQCMSNCSPITEYFLNAEHYRELNTGNPLGMGGEIAKSYGELVKSMWSGKYPSIPPHQFKMQVGRFAPQFSGYQQHDSQELLTFLLDGLHEDLNRIKDKPYIELQDGEGLPDEELAKISWENYLKRNDSVIVDFFHGLLKSTVVCPDCNKISVTFDPFCYLSLPLPQKKERVMEVVLVYDDPTKKPVRYKLAVPKMGKVRDICVALNEITQIPEDKMFVAQVVRSHFHKMFSLDSHLSSISDKEDIFIYELPVASSQTEHKVVPVFLWQISDDEDGPSRLFGIPFVVVVPKKKCMFEVLYSSILRRMYRFISHPKLNNDSSQDDSRTNNGTYLFEDPPNEIDEYSQTKQCDYLFSIHRYSSNSHTTTVVEPNGKPLDFSNLGSDQIFTTQWTRKNRSLYFKDNVANEIDCHESVRQRRFNLLQLKDCLELYTTTEKLGVGDAWFCPKCKKHQCATKKFDLWTLPRILIIHLKRFSYNRCTRDKIDTLVDFPLNGLDMKDYVINQTDSPAVYDLFAVCNHYGGMGGGHYTAYAKNKLDGKWYCFDDNSVTFTGKEPVVSPAAYVLFYVQRDMNKSNTCVRQRIKSTLPAAYGGYKYYNVEDMD